MANKAKKEAPVSKRKYKKRAKKPVEPSITRKNVKLHGNVLPYDQAPLEIPRGLELYRIESGIPIPGGPHSAISYERLEPLISKMKIGENIAIMASERPVASRINHDKGLGFVFRYSYTDDSQKFIRVFRAK